MNIDIKMEVVREKCENSSNLEGPVLLNFDKIYDNIKLDTNISFYHEFQGGKIDVDSEFLRYGITYVKLKKKYRIES